MSNAFLTPAAAALLLSLGIGVATAQQTAPRVEAPAAPQPAPAQTVPAPVAPSESAADRKAREEAARLCGTIKDRTAEIACLQAHAANRAAEKEAAEKRAVTVPAPDANQKAGSPNKPPTAPRPGG